jgi:hypothetical protein
MHMHMHMQNAHIWSHDQHMDFLARQKLSQISRPLILAAALRAGVDDGAGLTWVGANSAAARGETCAKDAMLPAQQKAAPCGRTAATQHIVSRNTGHSAASV